MKSTSKVTESQPRLRPWLLLLLLALLLGGCATENDSLLPWATPAPHEGSIPLPGSFTRQ